MNKINWFLAPLFGLLLAACGGGGGDGEDPGNADGGGGGGGQQPKAEFDGNYTVIGGLGTINPTTVQSTTGSATADPTTLTMDVIVNVDGDAINNSTLNIGYRIGANGRLTLTGSGVDIQEGGISFDGEAAISAAVGNLPSNFFALLRRPSSFDPSLLTNTPAYHAVSFFRNAPFDRHEAIVRKAVFQGDGNVRLEAGSINTDGTIGVSPQLILPFTVQADGQMTITPLSGSPSLGSVTGDATLALLAGEVLAGGFPHLMAFVAESTNATNAVLQGEYYMISFTAESNGYSSRQGIINFDGNGSALSTLQRKLNGGIPSSDIDAVTYAVAPDGGLELTYTARTATLAGGVSADGRYAILGGATTGRPAFELLVRKPQ